MRGSGCVGGIGQEESDKRPGGPREGEMVRNTERMLNSNRHALYQKLSLRQETRRCRRAMKAVANLIWRVGIRMRGDNCQTAR